MKWGLAAAVTLACILALTSARAGDEVQRAKAHFAIGTRAYDEKKFLVAIDAFEEAHRLAPRPAILFSIAQAYRRQYYIDRKLDDLANAVAHYKQYIAEDPKGARVGEAGTILAEIEPMAERLGAKVPTSQEAKPTTARILIAPSVKGAKAQIDGGAPIELPARVEVPPGPHTVVVAADGFVEERRELKLEMGEAFALDVKMSEKPARMKVDSGSGVTVYVDGRQSGETPLVAPVSVDAGVHVVSLTRSGSIPVTMEVNLAPGESKTLKPHFSASGIRVASVVVMSIGAAGIAAGAVMVGLAYSEESTAQDISDAAGSRNVTTEEQTQLADALNRRNTYRNAAIGCFAAGGAVTLTGILLFFLDNPGPGPLAPGPRLTPKRKDQPEKEPVFEAHLVPSFGADGAAITVVGRF